MAKIEVKNIFYTNNLNVAAAYMKILAHLLKFANKSSNAKYNFCHSHCIKHELLDVLDVGNNRDVPSI